MPGGWIYILTNCPNGTSYVGVAAELPERAHQHRTGFGSDPTHRHNLARLVYVEQHDSITGAIQRVKNLKHWPRAWKLALIQRDNPGWDDPS